MASRRQPRAHHHLGWSLAVDVIRRTDKRHRRRNQCAPRWWPRWLLYVCVQITRPPSYAPAWRTAPLRFSLSLSRGETLPDYKRLPLLVAPRESRTTGSSYAPRPCAPLSGNLRLSARNRRIPQDGDPRVGVVAFVAGYPDDWTIIQLKTIPTLVWRNSHISYLSAFY